LICDPSNGEQVKQSVVKKNEAELRGIKPNDIKNYYKKNLFPDWNRFTFELRIFLK
jgi:hypothetical protein